MAPGTMVRSLTRSLRAPKASKAPAGSDYRVALPAVTDAEVGSLAVAFRRMAAEVAGREEALGQLNPASAEGRLVMLTGRPLCDTNGQVSGGLADIFGRIERAGACLDAVGDQCLGRHGRDPARGERRLSLGTRHDAGRGLVVIEVEDTGQGVMAELAERLFDPWVTDRRNALGIGLAIARTIVEAYRGEIRIEPGIDTGALFLAELPVGRESKP